MALPGPATPGSSVVPPSTVRLTNTSLAQRTLEGRFPPGALLASRYRISGLLGRGGMGEVYRADDLVLEQQVALKFLPDEIAERTERIERFRAEVRVAREVSHPNVCRVYDIGEIDGHPFLSMEYIDGENLTSLLRRIGRLPHDTAVDMARQLCAGLAAAHDKGVLHRDLKPANVMIDGRGKVRLADFGLASLVEESGRHALAGTPAYMAPELFDHKPPSIQSDIYALGLVLYEMFAGKPAFTAATIGELARLHHESMPTSLSRVLSDADPVVERVIQRCLSKDPVDRPASALAVAAALPGGDPLAAALAAGETPSPQMVAASGGVGALTPAIAVACTAAALIGLVVVVLLSGRTQPIRYAPASKAPEILADQAESIVRRLGYTTIAGDRSYGFTGTDYITYLRTSDRSPSRWENLRAGQPPGFTFWYRESPSDLIADGFSRAGRVRLSDPTLRIPGEVAMMLDLNGHLHQLMVVAPRFQDQASPAPDWSALFREAGLDLSRFTSAPVKWTPPVFADTRAAWDGVYPDRPDIAVHIEAASVSGKPVFFQIFEPWSRTTLVPGSTSRVLRLFGIALFAAACGLMIGALLLVRRNIRLGRGDQAGALRLAFVLFLTQTAAGVLGADHNLSPSWIAGVLTGLVARGLLIGALAWIFYVALEPDLRRRAPHMLISWTRVLAGHFTDPRVGRDILIGVLGATSVQLLTQVGYVAPRWFGDAPVLSPATGPAISIAELLAAVLSYIGGAVLVATSFVLVVFLLTIVLRRRVLVAGVLAVVYALLTITQSGLTATSAFGLLVAVVTAVIVVRVGLLAFIVMSFLVPLLDRTPMVLEPRLWYSTQSWLVLAIAAGLALFGMRTAVAGRPLVAGGWLKD